jgi:hypothetical protein
MFVWDLGTINNEGLVRIWDSAQQENKSDER